MEFNEAMEITKDSDAMEITIDENHERDGRYTNAFELISPSATERITVHLENLLVLRAQKTDPSINPCDDSCASETIQTLTILQNVPVNVVRLCCAVLAYILKLRGGIVPQDFNSSTELTPNEREQLQILNGVRDFTHYMELCKQLVETVLENGRRVYHLFELQKQNKEQNKEQNNKESEREKQPTDEHASQIVDEDDEAENELSLIHDLLRNMNSVFLRFYDMFVNGSGFPREKIYERLFVSGCVSRREPLSLQRKHLVSLDCLFSMLSHEIIVSTDHCNTHFEAFFGTGILFTVLLNIITEKFAKNETLDNWSSTLPANAMEHWTRVRLSRNEDREAIHFFKDTNSIAYKRAVARLPIDLFDAESGLDVYLTKGDTLCTMFVQFIGRVFLRTYEWPLRSDVFSHLKEHFVCDNLQRLFASIGRGQDQRAWIRFFKRNHDRSPRVYIQIEPLFTLNDELIGGNESRINVATNTKLNETAILEGSGGCTLKSTASADASRRYQLHRDFINRYNEFMSNKNGELREYWDVMRTVFAANSGGWEQNSVYEQTDSPLTDFHSWCREINLLIFPYNFLLIPIIAGGAERHRLDEKTLSDAWVLKCQEYLLARRINSTRCKQILDFFKRLEIKSRLILEEKKFMFLFSEAMDKMPFLYSLFGESLTEMESNV